MSWSDIMTLGRPWSQKTELKKIQAVSGAITLVLVSMKYIIFNNILTNTMIISFLALVIGNYIIKSIDITSYFSEGISIGCKRPASAC